VIIMMAAQRPPPKPLSPGGSNALGANLVFVSRSHVCRRFDGGEPPRESGSELDLLTMQKPLPDPHGGSWAVEQQTSATPSTAGGELNTPSGDWHHARLFLRTRCAGASGRFFTAQGPGIHVQVAVLGSKLASELFGSGQSRSGKKITVGDTKVDRDRRDGREGQPSPA